MTHDIQPLMDRRRSSYASVVAGGAGSSAGQTPPARAGAFSHMLPQNLPPPSTLGQLQDPTQEEPTSTSVPASWGKSTAVPAHWNQPSHERPYGASAGTMFLRPSYLRGSRYMERLEATYREKLTAQRDTTTTGSGVGTTSLSTSSSSVSLHRMAPSHRGMTYEIVESRPPAGEDDSVPPLPSKWAEVDRHGGLEVQLESGGQEIKYGHAKSLDHEAAAARTDHPMPPECGIYYYEVEVMSKGKDGYGSLRCDESC